MVSCLTMVAKPSTLQSLLPLTMYRPLLGISTFGTELTTPNLNADTDAIRTIFFKILLNEFGKAIERTGLC